MSEALSPMEADTSPVEKELAFRLQPDGRQLLTRKRAGELLAPLFTLPYTSITLGGCAIGDAAAGVAGPALLALANKRCVRSVTLADCIASLNQEEAVRSLTALSASIGLWKGLRSVDLSYNALGSIGVAQCAPLLQGQRHLEELRLIEAGLAAESARLIKGFVCQGPTTRLRLLHVHLNRVDSAGLGYFAEIVEKSPDLESLRLSSLGARGPSLAILAAALKGKTNMLDLDLSDNLLDVPAAQELAEVVVALPKLERLVLRDLDMGDDGLSALLSAFLVADPKPPLMELALAGNELTPASSSSIASALSAFAGVLQVLDLGRNELGAPCVEAISGALADLHVGGERVALTQLFISENRIPALPIVRLAIQLLGIPEFHCLDIKDNFVSEGVFDSLSTALGSNVVLFDVLEPGEVAEGEIEAEEQSEADNEALQAALQELGNAPSQLRREQPVREQPPGSSELSSSTQSRSAVSRLRSLFSRGSENDSQQASFSRPADAEEELTTSTQVAPCGSLEDDSGLVRDSSDLCTPSPGSRNSIERGITVTTTSTTDAMSTRDAPSSPFTPMSNVNSSSTKFVNSAQKLKEGMVSLAREMSDAAGELQIPVSSSPLVDGSVLFSRRDGEVVGDVNEYLLVGDLPQDGMRKQSAVGVVVDVVGGLLVGAFIVILVLAIAQSQEESTFAYRLV